MDKIDFFIFNRGGKGVFSASLRKQFKIMTKETGETLSPQEILEVRIGESGIKTLIEVAGMLDAGAKGSLRIRDQTLVDPTIEMIKQFTQKWRAKESQPPVNFVEADFRKQWSKAILAELTKILGDVKIYHDTYIGDQGRKEDNQRAHSHRKKDRLIFVNPLAVEDRISNMNEAREEDEAFNRIILYVKYGMSTLTILPEKPTRLPYYVSELVGEYSDWSFFLDYDPYKKG